ncbi:MAG: putative kinase [Anaerolineales bacterium]|nr:putative kinase [Anaerolineales bacterium]
MIIVQTPLRVSFFGGGTDLRSFFAVEGGCVLSSAIDKYIFITIKKRFDQWLRIGYTRTEMVEAVGEVQHELIREALRKTGISRGVEVTTMGDIPSAGSGLGSSSTVTVGALHAMYTFLGEIVPAERLAREACEIEIDILGKPIGVQDQYIAAYGGLRFMEFTLAGQVLCERIDLGSDLLRRLNESLLLFFTGVTRQADSILGEQKRNINDRMAILREMKQMAYTARDELRAGDLEAMGRLLHEGWQLKKQLASQISNGAIDEMYQTARRAGALGGKITGAGGGGFLLLYCLPERREAVRDALKPLQELPFQLEMDGTKVILNYRRQ